MRVDRAHHWVGAVRLTIPVTVDVPNNVGVALLRRRMEQALNDHTPGRYRFHAGEPEPEWEYVGNVAVDSGQVVIVDPSYVIDGLDYDAVCSVTLARARAGELLFSGVGGVGVASSSGYGDWVYGAYVQRVADDINGVDSGQCVAALKVVFIAPGD